MAPLRWVQHWSPELSLHPGLCVSVEGRGLHLWLCWAISRAVEWAPRGATTPSICDAQDFHMDFRSGRRFRDGSAWGITLPEAGLRAESIIPIQRVHWNSWA